MAAGYFKNDQSETSGRTPRIGTKRHRVKRGESHTDVQSRRYGTDPLQHFAQKPRAILETPAVLPFSRMRAQKFVPQITVAMLDVHEIEAQFPRHFRCAMKIFNDRLNFAIGQNGIVASQSQSPIQDRVMIKDARLRLAVCIRPAESSGMCQLQSDE